MRPYTEAERAALIEDCNAEIERLQSEFKFCESRLRWGRMEEIKSQLNRQQIALAALTAEPAGKFYAGTRGKVSIHPSEALPLGFNPFYTAPPVAALRLPDEKWINPAPGFESEDSYKEGWNECLEEVKRLNANKPAEEKK